VCLCFEVGYAHELSCVGWCDDAVKKADEKDFGDAEQWEVDVLFSEDELPFFGADEHIW